MDRIIEYARRYAKSAGYASLAAGILALGAYYPSRETPISDGIFLGVAHKRDLAPYGVGDERIYNLGKSRVVASSLSDVVYLFIAIDGDGIRNASLTFDGVELMSTYSDDPRNKGIKDYGVLDPKACFEGEYVLRLTVTDQTKRLMVRSVIIELRANPEHLI